MNTDEPDDEAVTRGGYVLPPPVSTGQFVGPADDPDRYELTGPGRSGGEGTTWRARYHGRLQAPLPLAVKQLRPPPGSGSDWPSASERRRWLDQAALLRHVQPDHVVRLYEIFPGPPPHEAGKGRADEPQAAYLVMEWIEGPTLDQLCHARPATRETIRTRLGYVGQAATALTELSSATRSGGNPSLHRDIKPSNCIINDERGLVLIDISTLRLVDDGFDPVGLHTPQYTAPEVLAAPNLPRMPATDVYSLGALAAFCLTGQDPTPSEDNRADLVAAARAAGVADPSGLAAQIMTALDPDPMRRPTDLLDWSRQLAKRGRTRSPRSAYAVASAGITALVAAFLAIGPPGLLLREVPADPPTPPPPSGFAGTITSPVDGSNVRQCSYFVGTGTVPSGWTFGLAMRNLVNGDPARYVEVVFGWDDPARLSSWRGAQYFGNGNETAGQDYRVELIAVPVDAVREWHDNDDPGTALAASGFVLDHVDLHRVEGLVANACVGP